MQQLKQKLNMVDELEKKLQQQNKELMNFLPREVKRIRLNLDMTQPEFANMLGITQGYLSSIETGRIVPGLELVNRIANLEN